VCVCVCDDSKKLAYECERAGVCVSVSVCVSLCAYVFEVMILLFSKQLHTSVYERCVCLYVWVWVWVCLGVRACV